MGRTMRLISFNESLKQKGYKAEDLSKEEIFRYGQIAILAGMADILGVSMTYNGLDWIEEIAKELKKYRDQEKGIDKVTYDKLFGVSKLSADAADLDFTYDGIQL